jgi:hypothetical protein
MVLPGAPLIRGVRMSGCVKGKVVELLVTLRWVGPHPYETSRNLVIRGHPRLDPFVAMIPLWEWWLPSFRKMA